MTRISRTHRLAAAAAVTWGLQACGLWTQDTYTVVRGDTLFAIAQQHGVTVDELRMWNGIEGDLIEVGQVLVIAGTAPATRGPAQAKPKKSRPRGGLTMPPRKSCLKGPGGTDLGEDDLVASRGLTREQVSASMRGFVHHTLRCVPADTPPAKSLQLELTVACTGRVSKVSVVDAGDWGAEAAGCVADVLGYTPFPAHDLPDGEVFLYPLRYTP